MGIFDLFKSKKIEVSIPKIINIYSPIDGRVIPLGEIPDTVYAEKTMGDGCGIEPTGDTIYSPVDGEIDIVGINHAIFIETEDLEMIFHFGIVNKYSLTKLSNSSLLNLNSSDKEKNFIKEKGLIKLAENSNCKKREKLVKIDKELIKEYFYSFKSPFIITNMDKVALLEIMAKEEVKAGDLLMRVILK